LEWKYMETMDFTEQATWWNRQDVVVAAHGAAMGNIMFLRPHTTAVVEIFPRHYYVDMYQRLSETLNVTYFGYYSLDDDTEDLDDFYPQFDYLKHCSKRKERYAMRAVRLTPPVRHIMDLIHKAVDHVVLARQWENEKRRGYAE